MRNAKSSLADFLSCRRRVRRRFAGWLGVCIVATTATLAAVPLSASAAVPASLTGTGSGFTSPNGVAPVPSAGAIPANSQGANCLGGPGESYTVVFKSDRGGPVIGTYDYEDANGIHTLFDSLGNCKHATCTGQFTGTPDAFGFSIDIEISGNSIEILSVKDHY
jgi:hypothetical protein